MKLYVWRNNPSWLAVAHAGSVAEARNLLLGDACDIGGLDGSCVVRAKARAVISEKGPEIWSGPNAEFVLTDSAELEEQDAVVTALRAELAAATERAEKAEQERDAIAAALDGSKNCPKCHGFGYVDGGGPRCHYETDSAEERALTDMWRRVKCDCRKLDPAAFLAAHDAQVKREGWVGELDDELIVRELSPVKDGETFKSALNRLQCWEIAVALDPCVSTDAKRLKTKGAVEALEGMGCLFYSATDCLEQETLASCQRCRALAVKRQEAKG